MAVSVIRVGAGRIGRVSGRAFSSIPLVDRLVLFQRPAGLRVHQVELMAGASRAGKGLRG
jgi:hypothetical protein